MKVKALACLSTLVIALVALTAAWAFDPPGPQAKYTINAEDCRTSGNPALCTSCSTVLTTVTKAVCPSLIMCESVQCSGSGQYTACTSGASGTNCPGTHNDPLPTGCNNCMRFPGMGGMGGNCLENNQCTTPGCGAMGGVNFPAPQALLCQ